VRYDGNRPLRRSSRSSVHRFLEDFVAFQTRIAHFGAFNSLAQTLVKITAPGVPDFYQGSELWDLNLVDPDNRRPVDWHSAGHVELTRSRQTAPTRRPSSREIMKGGQPGQLCRIARPLPRRVRGAFSEGDYRP
jgi:(1->4)-alpha-D-glucan 1-alpha-D-glucosylmutase